MLFENETFRIARSPFLALVLKEEASSPWWKSAPLPSRLGNVLKLLSRERKRPVFSDFHHRLLGSALAYLYIKALDFLIQRGKWNTQKFGGLSLAITGFVQYL